jgi:hypothetical protein
MRISARSRTASFPPKKTVSWVIIGVGGFLGIADKLVAIPRMR